MEFWPDATTCVRRRRRRSLSSFIHYKVSGSNISRNIWPWITNCHTDRRTNSLYSQTKFDVTSYFRSEVVEEKTSKMLPVTTTGGISRERLKRGSGNFTHISGANILTNVLVMTSLAASNRLQNTIKCGTKDRKTGPVGQRVEELGNCLTQNQHIVQGQPCRHSLKPRRSHCLRWAFTKVRKNGRNAASRRLWDKHLIVCDRLYGLSHSE